MEFKLKTQTFALALLTLVAAACGHDKDKKISKGHQLP
jgi:hypothetical protein